MEKDNEDIHNDGSNYNTEAILKEIVHEFPDLNNLLSLDDNRGKAEAIRQGMNWCLNNRELKYIGYLDANLSSGFDKLPEFIKVFQDNSEIRLVLGSRISDAGYEYPPSTV